MPKIYFKKEHIEYTIKENQNILDVVQELNIPITSHCGGKGSCISCVFELIKGKVSSEPLPGCNEYLSCQSRPMTDVTINVIDLEGQGSSEESHVKNLVEVGVEKTINPLVEKYYVSIEKEPLKSLNDLIYLIKDQLNVSVETIEPIVKDKFSALINNPCEDITVTLLETEAHQYSLIDIEEDIKYHFLKAVGICIYPYEIVGYLVDLYQEQIVEKSTIEIDRSFIVNQLAKPDVLKSYLIDQVNKVLVELAQMQNLSTKDINYGVLSYDPLYKNLFGGSGDSSGIIIKNLYDMGCDTNEAAKGFIVGSVFGEITSHFMMDILTQQLAISRDSKMLIHFGESVEIGVKKDMTLYTTSVKGSFERGDARIRDGMDLRIVEDYADLREDIRAGLKGFSETAHIDYNNLKEIIVSGNFGQFFDFDKAFEFGIVPHHDRCYYRYVGNAEIIGVCNLIINKKNMDILSLISGGRKLLSDQENIREYCHIPFTVKSAIHSTGEGNARQ